MRIPFLDKIFKRSTLANPESWLMEALGARKSAAGVAVTENNALYSTAVYACVRIISETVASLPLPVYRRLQGGGKERAPDHALYTVLHDIANEEMTSFTLREVMMSHVLLWGNAYAEIERNGRGEVVALWPLRPDKTTPQRNASKKIEYKTEIDGQVFILPAKKVLHLYGLGFDGLIGYSPIKLAREAIGLGMATEEFGARFFSNGAHPSGIIEYPGKLKDTALEQFKQSVQQAYGGLSKSHRMMVLEEGLKYHQVGIPPEDAQFLETRKFQIAEIARFFRVPLHMIGELDRATNNNIEHQSIEFVVHTIRPWLVRIEQAMAMKLFLPTERKTYFSEFLVDGLLRGDLKSRYEAYQIARQNGWLSADDIRELENMNPLPNGQGKIYLVNSASVPIDQVGQQKGGDVGENGEGAQASGAGTES